MTTWWHLGVEDISRRLETNGKTGLSPASAAEKLEKHGPNQLQEKKGRGPLAIFLDQFKELMIWVLIGAALVSGFLKEWVDAVAIIAIVILNAILGLVQEYRAEKSLAALKKLSAPSAKVIRGGASQLIPARELVPGDLVELEAGDHIPADSRIVWHTSNFAVQEASLTGESTPVEKTDLALDEKDVPLAERANIVYLGTSVVSGKARAFVVETGMQTELGRIAGMIQDIEKETTPLQRKLEEFGKVLVYLCFVLVAVVFGLEILRGGKILDMFLTAVSLAVAAIPEGLPAVVTIALALGVQRMVKRHVLIRKLPSVETLGCATVICSDKTGTLTKNEMTVRAVWTSGSPFEVTGTGYEPPANFSRIQRPSIPGAPRPPQGPDRRRPLQRRRARPSMAARPRSSATRPRAPSSARRPRPASGKARRRIPSSGRGDPVRLRAQEDDHRPPGRPGPDALSSRGRRTSFSGTAPTSWRTARSVRSPTPTASGSCRPTTARQPGPPRPGRGLPEPRPGAPLLRGGDDRARPDVRRPGGHDRPAPRRSARGHRQVPHRGHPDGHDHRRPQEHGRGHRPRARVLTKRIPRP